MAAQNIEQWRDLVSRYFRPEDVEKALHVITYESSGNPGARSDSGGYGLFQLNDGGLGEGLSTAQRLDPETNIRTAAAAVYGGQGWAPWGENNLYNGQVFGALGNHPFEGGGSTGGAPFNGRAAVGSGITATGGGGNTYGIYNNLTQKKSGGVLGDIFGSIPEIVGAIGDGARSRGAGTGATGTTSSAGGLELTLEEALAIANAGSGGSNYIPPDHFWDTSPGSQRDFDESVLRDRRDFDYNKTMDELDRAQQEFDNALAVGDVKAAQKAAEDLNYWKGVDASQGQQRINLDSQGQQLDYNLGLGNIAANRYSTDAGLAQFNAQLGADTALGQQRNKTGQFDAETARLRAHQDYVLGMANAKTDAERAATDEKRRQDMVAIANMESGNNFTLGQQRNNIDAYGAVTDRQSSNQGYQASLAGLYNDLLGLGIQDADRVDRNSQFNVGETNDFNLGQQSNRTNQFGAETDRANRMGQLALQNNQAIADRANDPREMFNMFLMQRGVAPDWATIMAGGDPARGQAWLPSDVMGAYKPVTEAGTFDLTAAQAQASQNPAASQGFNLDTNPFLKDWERAAGTNDTIGGFNATAQQATGQPGSNYNSSQNQFIGADPGYTPTTQAPSFDYVPTPAQAPQWNGPAPVSGFLPTNTQAPAGPPKTYSDINPGGLQGGVPLASMQQGLNLSTVGGGDIMGSDFSLPSFYDQGMTQRIGAGDTVKGGSQVWSWYGDGLPGGGAPLIAPYDPNQVPKFAGGVGLTREARFVTGDDPESPDGLGQNAELNEPYVNPDGTYAGTRITPLNPERRSLGKTWNNDIMRLAAGFGVGPKTIFS